MYVLATTIYFTDKLKKVQIYLFVPAANIIVFTCVQTSMGQIIETNICL